MSDKPPYSLLLDWMTESLALAPTAEPVASGVLWNDGGVITLSVGIPPAFSDHPDDDTVDEGDTVTFSWAATNATSYQLQKQEGGVGAWANVSGATSSPWTSGALTNAADNGDVYRVVATGPGGTTNSNSATLTVNDPVTVTLIYDDNFTIDRAAPITNASSFAASGAGNNKLWCFPADGTGAAISGGKFNLNSATGWVFDAAAARSRLAGRIHYCAFNSAAAGSFTETRCGLVDDSGTIYWATSIGGPTIKASESPGSLRSDDAYLTGRGYTWKATLALSTLYEWCLIERPTGSFSLMRVSGGDWRFISFEKHSNLAGKIAFYATGGQAVSSLNRLCTANTSFIPTPLIQHAFASVTGPSDGAGQSETGGSGVAATTAGSVTISGSTLQMSADGTGSVVFETGVTEVAVAADFTVYDGSPCGLVLRYQDASNYLFVRLNSTANTIALVEVVGGSETTLVSMDSITGDSFDLANAASVMLQAHIDGNLIRAFYYQGSLHRTYIEWTSTRFASATKAGVFVSKGAGVNSAKASNLVVFAQVQVVPEMVNT